jgi:sulfur carrier protein
VVLFEPCQTPGPVFFIFGKVGVNDVSPTFSGERGIRREKGPETVTECSQIRIVLNGTSREVASGTTIAGLLDNLSLPGTRVAVERNGEIVRRPVYEATGLAEGDRLEIVTFVGGG